MVRTDYLENKDQEVMMVIKAQKDHVEMMEIKDHKE